MPRPLMQLGVGQLEDLFAKSKTEQKVLKQLEHELQFRKVPRAAALLAEVQASMFGETAAPPQAVTPTAFRAPTIIANQPGLWDRPIEQSAPVTASEPVSSVTHAPPMVRHPETLPTAKLADPAIEVIQVEDAYRLLKATASSDWELIELTRRTLVLQSHPERVKVMTADKRSNAIAEAKRVNAAYVALSQERCSGR